MPFWWCFACPKLGDAGRTRVASKNRAVQQKITRPQFWLLSKEQRIFLCTLLTSSREDFALKSKLRPWYFFQHRLRYFFLTWNKGQLWAAATRVLLASPNFGQAKHCQKGPAATFPPKGVCSPMYTHLITFYGPLQTISLFVFKLEAKEKKISIFHKFASPHTKFCVSSQEDFALK